MSETLSQDEVSALLRGLADGDVPAEEAVPEPGTTRDYDLLGEERIVGRRFQALDLVRERLVRRLKPSLAGVLGTPPEVEAKPLELIKFATFRNRLETPANLHLFTMAPLRGQALVVVSSNLAYGLVDKVFGGLGRVPTSGARRECSAIEMQTVQRVVALALADFADALASVHPIACAFTRSETNPISVAICAPTDQILLLPFHCDLGSGPTPLTFAIPFAMLEPIRTKLGEPEAAERGPDATWLAALRTVIEATDVTMSVELGIADLTAREILRLKVGDLVTIETRADDPLAVSVEGIRLLTGVPGVSRGNNAVRVVAKAA
ncbi:MAG: flagellar motor switch protein FliM [Deltaproteobacteria bacterium]|nr:flagellar motor switch protein FliM [Deltaproteobacteria bacterium]